VLTYTAAVRQVYDIFTRCNTNSDNKQTTNSPSSSAHATRQSSPTPVLIASTSHLTGTSRSRTRACVGLGCPRQPFASTEKRNHIPTTPRLLPVLKQINYSSATHPFSSQHTKTTLHGNTPAALLIPSVSWQYGGHREHCRPLQGR
jgi:hypothetical protein